MEFSHAEYFELLRLYETYSAKAKRKDNAVREAACAWLKQEFNTVGNKSIHNYQRWYRLGQEKQKLLIGGIFPLNGEKFKAPELLPGEPYTHLTS